MIKTLFKKKKRRRKVYSLVKMDRKNCCQWHSLRYTLSQSLNEPPERCQNVKRIVAVVQTAQLQHYFHMILQPVETFGLVFLTVDDYQISQRSRSTFTPAGRGTLPICLLLTQWGKTSTGPRDWPQWNLRNEELVGRWGDEQEGDTWSLNTGQQFKSLLSGTESEPQRGMCNHNTPCYGAVTWDILLIDHLNQECICGGNC